MGKGDHQSQDYSVANPAPGSDQVGCHHRLAMSRTQGVSSAVDEGEKDRQQHLPQRCFSQHQRLDDVADLRLFALLFRVPFGPAREGSWNHRSILADGGWGGLFLRRVGTALSRQLCRGGRGVGEGIETGRLAVEVDGAASPGGTKERSLILDLFWTRVEDVEGEIGIVIFQRDPRVLTRCLLQEGVVLPVDPPAATPGIVIGEGRWQAAAQGVVGIEGARSYRSLQSSLFDQGQLESDRLAVDAKIEERQQRVDSLLKTGSPLRFLDPVIAVGVEFCQYRETGGDTPPQVEEDRYLPVADGEGGLGADTLCQFMTCDRIGRGKE